MTQLRVSALTLCPRRAAYEALGAEARFSPYLERVMYEGSLHEPEILGWAVRTLDLDPINQQDEVWPHPRVSGHYDMLASNGELVLLEAKCVGSRSFYEIKQRGVEAVLHYEEQVLLYWAGLLNAGHDVRRAYLVVRNRETPRTRMYDHELVPVEYDQTVVDAALAKAEYILSCLDRGELPDRSFAAGDWQCRYCGYREQCWGSMAAASTQHATSLPADFDLEWYSLLKAEVDELKTELDQMTEQLKALAPGAYEQGSLRVRIIERVSERLDVTRARQELGDLLQKYMTTVTSCYIKLEEV